MTLIPLLSLMSGLQTKKEKLLIKNANSTVIQFQLVITSNNQMGKMSYVDIGQLRKVHVKPFLNLKMIMTYTEKIVEKMNCKI